MHLLYIDPTAGGLFLQMLLGGTAGLLVILRIFWARMRRRIAGILKRQS